MRDRLLRCSLPTPQLANPCGGPIVCHNDVCPENVVFRDGEAFALLDFDLAAPGTPVWDLGDTARMWIPFLPPELAGERAHLDPFHRLAVIAAGYGLDRAEHQSLVDAIVVSKQLGTRFVECRVRAHDPATAAHAARGSSTVASSRSYGSFDPGDEEEPHLDAAGGIDEQHARPIGVGIVEHTVHPLDASKDVVAEGDETARSAMRRR